MTTIGSKGITDTKRWNWFIEGKLFLSNYWSEEKVMRFSGRCTIMPPLHLQPVHRTMQTMNTMMDLDNMVDYFASETYYPNDDWMGGGNNNLKLWRPNKTGGRFRYLSHDLDFGLGLVGGVTNDMLGTALNPSPHNYNSDIFQKLVQNPQFKMLLHQPLCWPINTIWLPSSVQNMAYLFRDSLRSDIHFQYDKWGGGDSTSGKIISPRCWLLQIASIQCTWIYSVAFRNDYKSRWLFRLLLPVPEGSRSVLLPLQVIPGVGVYFNGNPVTITAIPNPVIRLITMFKFCDCN